MKTVACFVKWKLPFIGLAVRRFFRLIFVNNPDCSLSTKFIPQFYGIFVALISFELERIQVVSLNKVRPLIV